MAVVMLVKSVFSPSTVVFRSAMFVPSESRSVLSGASASVSCWIESANGTSGE